MSAAHARLGPSAADRWTVCPRSVREIERLVAEGKIDPHASSGAADEGTAAHQVRGDALDLGLDAWDFLGTSITINGVEYPCDEDMCVHLQPGIDWLREQEGTLIVEHRVDLSAWMPGQFGTLDTGVINYRARRATINDLKYGAGVDVQAVENKQLRIYAIGTMDNFDLWDKVDEVELVIDQPRLGGMKHWSVSAEELREFAHEVKAAALRVDDPDAPFVASEKGCYWCPVKDSKEGCPAYTAWMGDIFDNAFDEDDDTIALDVPPSFTPAHRITPERRWYIVKHAHLAEKWLAKLHQDSIDSAKAGFPDPGSKLVAGRRGDRYYKDTNAAEMLLLEHLGNDAFTYKLKSIAQVEKIFKPTRKRPGNPDALSELNKLVGQDEGKPVLVPDTDERPAIAPVDDLFDD